MMDALKGGRGRKLPWETTHVRVPVPIREEIQEKVDAWKAAQLGEDYQGQPNLLTGLETAKNIAKDVLKQKKSAKVTLERFLTRLYGQKVEL